MHLFGFLLLATAHAAQWSRHSNMAKPHNSTNDLVYVTLEEHCIPKVLAGELYANPTLALLVNGTFGPALGPALMDSGAGRINSMDQNNIRMQIISNVNLDLTNATAVSISNTAIHNDFVLANPTRLKAFCGVAMGQPSAAAAELERCITQLGFVGALTTANLPNGTFYDSPAYWPVFATAARLNVPFYLHPAFPPAAQVLTPGGMYAGALVPGSGNGTNASLTYNPYIAANLASTAWGFETSAGLSFLRLYAAGLFDEYPTLKIVLGHMGEMVPYILERSDYFLSPLTKPRRSLIEVWKENVWVTTSGYFALSQVPTLLWTTSIDRIMYSVDTPFNYNWQGSQFMDNLRASSLVSAEEFEKIAFRNAEKLLGL